MFAFTIDHRHTFEPSLQLYRASRSDNKANARGGRTPNPSSTAEAPPPAYTPTAEPTTAHGSTRRGTSGSTATISSTASSSSSTSSHSSTRSKLARLNPFRRRHTNATSTSPSHPNLSASSTTSSNTPHAHRPSRTVRFADPYDSDASSVYSTDFPPSQQTRPPTESTPPTTTTTSSGNDRATTTSSTSRLPYPRDVDENSTYPAFLFLF